VSKTPRGKTPWLQLEVRDRGFKGDAAFIKHALPLQVKDGLDEAASGPERL
jgi:hypothetical protein